MQNLNYEDMRNLLLVYCMLLPFILHAQTDTTYFTMLCGPCHTIGWGKKIGPDLKNISEKYSDEQLTTWIKELKMATTDSSLFSETLQKKMKNRRMPGFV